MNQVKVEWYPDGVGVWERDAQFSWSCEDGQRCYFDSETGRVEWALGPFHHSSEVDAVIELSRFECGSRYVEIPPLDHGEHHKILARFIAELPSEMAERCNTKSIGGFLETADQLFPDRAPWRRHWDAFKEDELKEIARGFYARHGWDVTWT